MANEQKPVIDVATLEVLKQFAAELKKPSAEEQAKIDADKANLLRRQEESIKQAKREKDQRDREQAMCSHMKPHPYTGKTRIVAPLHNDGLHHPRCLFCHKEFKPFAPSPETIPVGMSLDDFNGVSSQIIEHWGNEYEKKQKLLAVAG
jgi:hypothetical protein